MREEGILGYTRMMMAEFEDAIRECAEVDQEEVDRLAAEEQIAQLRAVLADAQHVFLAISEAGRRAENGRLQKVLDSIAQVYRAHNDFAAKHDVRAILDRGPTGGAK